MNHPFSYIQFIYNHTFLSNKCISDILISCPQAYYLKHYLLLLFLINLFLANGPILYPLKTPENLSFLVFSRGVKWEHWPEIG